MSQWHRDYSECIMAGKGNVCIMHKGTSQNIRCLVHLRCKDDKWPREGAEVQQYLPSGSHQAKKKSISSAKLHSCRNFLFLYWVSSAVPARIWLAEAVAPAQPWNWGGGGRLQPASAWRLLQEDLGKHWARVKGLLALGLEGYQGAHPKSQASSDWTSIIWAV